MKTTLICLGVTLILGLVTGLCIARPWQDTTTLTEAQAFDIRTTAATRAQTAAALQPILIVFASGLAAVALAGAALGTWAGYQTLLRRSRIIRPDRHGIMPIFILRPGECAADMGALAGPIVADQSGCAYSLPPSVIPQLQAGANQAAGTTRTMRAWATHSPSPANRSWRMNPELTQPQYALPPVETLLEDDNQILALLEGSPPTS